jgi:site-specific DNA recombinase
MFRLAADVQVYLHREAIDLRVGINGLAILVEQAMHLDPFGRAVFAFCNRRRDRIRLLFYDRSGFWLMMKRLEADRFAWPRGQQHSVVRLSREQLHWLLDGINLLASLTLYKTLHTDIPNQSVSSLPCQSVFTRVRRETGRKERVRAPDDEGRANHIGLEHLERSRRGKRHRARQGQVNVLSGAPYGYRYVRKSDDAAARYEINHAEADIVRTVYDHYVGAGMSIGAITRLLDERGVPTRRRISRWERTTVWAILRNPAYKGTACFGKTETALRQRITRSLRLRGGVDARDSAHRERPRSEWIEIAVPAIIDEDSFARAQELLTQNKQLAPRRTIAPSIVQGLVSCSKCGYALSRTSTLSSARNVHYYRCLGSDAWRHLGNPVCDNRPVRQDLLDYVVWNEVVRLLEDPDLIQRELDRRLAAARTSDPTRQREKALQRELTRTRKAIDRLLTAYQEELLSLDELRRRMPELRQRERALQTELNAILDQISDRAIYLRLAETLSDFLTRLRTSADTLDIQERHRIVRLVIKDILVPRHSEFDRLRMARLQLG